MATEKTAVTVTREELYALVWKKPLRTVGNDFGVSGTEIAKVCKDLGIPCPRRGHWMKLAHGKVSRRKSLPPRDAGALQEATIDPKETLVHREAGLIVSVDGTVARAERIELPVHLRGCHPLISVTRHALEATKPNSDGLLLMNNPGALNVTVSRQCIPRALRIMEAVLRACLGRGWTLETSEKGSNTTIRIGDDPVTVRLYEKLDRSEIEQSAKAKLESWYRPIYQYRPTGHLALQITDGLFDGTRCLWADGKEQRLDKKLSSFVAGLEIASDNLKKRRLMCEERERRWAEEARLRREREEQQKREKAEQEALLVQTEGLRKAIEIRALIGTLNERMSAEPGRYNKDAVAGWSRWANRVASRLDPFENGYFEGLAPQGSKPSTQ